MLKTDYFIFVFHFQTFKTLRFEIQKINKNLKTLKKSFRGNIFYIHVYLWCVFKFQSLGEFFVLKFHKLVNFILHYEKIHL